MPTVVVGESSVGVTVGQRGPQGPQGPVGPRGPQGVTPKFWSGTQIEYNNLGVYDAETLYIIINP